MNAPLRVPTSTRTPLIARSFLVVSRSGRAPPPPRSRGEEYQLPNLALALPPRPVLLVQAHERPRCFERLCSRLRLEHGRSKGIAWPTSPVRRGTESPQPPAPGR